MLSAPAMKNAEVLFLAMAPAVLLACGGGARDAVAPVNSAPNLITLADTPAGHKQLIDTLAKTGHKCEDAGKAVACDAKKEHAFTFAAAFAESPHRVVFVVPSAMKVPCEQAAPRFNALNHEFDTVTLTCENNDFAAAGVLVVPKAGFAPTEVTDYVDPWLAQLATIIQANHLEEIVK